LIRTWISAVLIAALLLPALTGCTTTRVSKAANEIDQAEVQELKVGETTKEEVLSMFGSPIAITINSAGLEVYTFANLDSRSQMWQVPPILVIYVDSVSSSKTKVLTVAFKDNKVANWNYTVSSAGGGFQAGGVQGGTIGD
jgi:outer membrane protein assembly factor BamE (lipoprotein component of BamABCDE complex)